MSSQTPEEIEREIAAQREQLAHTVDQLGQKFDVKGRAQARVAGVKDRATTDTGEPKPDLAAAAVGATVLVVGLIWWSRG